MSNCTLTIDWEDFGQLYGMYHYGTVTDPVGGAIERQTDIMLEMMDEANVRSTFFILGMLAQSRPHLVKKIAGAGHEIALHGQHHKAMFTLTPAEAYRDINESLQIVQEITGSRVLGYRAPFFSLINKNLYLLEILAELGIEYDSSIFPSRMKKYGISTFDHQDACYDLGNGRSIIELPLTVMQFMNNSWPVSGGGYFRMMPKAIVTNIYKRFAKQKADSMIYMHPYEFDSRPIDVSANYPENAKYSGLKVVALNLRWNIFRNSVRDKIRELLSQHKFITCAEKANYVKKTGISTKLLGRTQ